MNPTRRPLVTFLLLVSLLFSQLAVAAYACPGAQSMAAAGSMPEMPDCDMPDSPRDALCQAHCLQGDQSLDRSVVPVLAMVALPVSLPAIASAAHPAPRAGSQDSLLARPTGPPLAVRHCRFQI